MNFSFTNLSSLLDLLKKYLLSYLRILSTVLGESDTTMNKDLKIPPLTMLIFYEGRPF